MQFNIAHGIPIGNGRLSFMLDVVEVVDGAAYVIAPAPAPVEPAAGAPKRPPDQTDEERINFVLEKA